MNGERSGVRDDGGPETSAGRYLDLRREDVLLLFRRMQGVVRSDSREVREVTSLSLEATHRQRFMRTRGHREPWRAAKGLRCGPGSHGAAPYSRGSS